MMMNLTDIRTLVNQFTSLNQTQLEALGNFMAQTITTAQNEILNFQIQMKQEFMNDFILFSTTNTKQLKKMESDQVMMKELIENVFCFISSLTEGVSESNNLINFNSGKIEEIAENTEILLIAEKSTTLLDNQIKEAESNRSQNQFIIDQNFEISNQLISASNESRSLASNIELIKQYESEISNAIQIMERKRMN
jgi:hypothetical protein